MKSHTTYLTLLIVLTTACQKTPESAPPIEPKPITAHILRKNSNSWAHLTFRDQPLVGTDTLVFVEEGQDLDSLSEEELDDLEGGPRVTGLAVCRTSAAPHSLKAERKLQFGGFKAIKLIHLIPLKFISQASELGELSLLCNLNMDVEFESGRKSEFTWNSVRINVPAID